MVWIMKYIKYIKYAAYIFGAFSFIGAAIHVKNWYDDRIESAIEDGRQGVESNGETSSEMARRKTCPTKRREQRLRQWGRRPQKTLH